MHVVASQARGTEARPHRGSSCVLNTSWKCVVARTLGGAGWPWARWCRRAHMRPTPSDTRLPLPNSSMMTKERSVALLSRPDTWGGGRMMTKERSVALLNRGGWG